MMRPPRFGNIDPEDAMKVLGLLSFVARVLVETIRYTRAKRHRRLRRGPASKGEDEGR